MAYDPLSKIFKPYDDEGYMLLSLRNYLNGVPLYDRMFAQYGPFFFMMQGWIYTLFHVPLSHDGGRVVTLVCWLGAAGAGSVMIFRYSRDLVLTAVTFVAISGGAKILANEPGHPQQDVLLLLMVAGLVSTWAFNGHGTWPFLILGAIGSALVLIKINVGVFYLIAFGSALITFSISRRARYVAWVIGGVLYAVLPVVLMHARWQGFAAIALLLAAAGALLALASARVVPAPFIPLRGLIVAAAGGLLAGVAITCATLAHGVSLTGLWNGAFMAPLRHPGVFWWPFIMTGLERLLLVPAFILGTVCALDLGVLHSKRVYVPLLQVIVGSGILLALVGGLRAGVLCAAFFFPLTLLNRMPEQQSRYAFTNFFVTHMALLQILQLYPVPGSQVGVAATVIIVWTCILLAAGIAGLPAALSQIPSTALLAMMVVPVALWSLWRVEEHITLVPSDLPGSSWIHMAPEQAATYRWMTLNLPTHCDTLFSMPGMGSLNIWSGVREPSSLFMTAWMSGFSVAQKQAVTAALEAHARPCVVYNPQIVDLWTAHVNAADHDPLENYTLKELHSAAAAGGYQVRVADREASWSTDLIVTSARELTGDAIGLPEGLFQPGVPSTIRFQVRSGPHGLGIQSTCLVNSALPCLSIRKNNLALGTAAAPPSWHSIVFGDDQWHFVSLRNSDKDWKVLVDGQLVAQTEIDPAWTKSPAYLLTGNGILQDFVLSRGL